jgi:hypothetical protein
VTCTSNFLAVETNSKKDVTKIFFASVISLGAELPVKKTSLK